MRVIQAHTRWTCVWVASLLALSGGCGRDASYSEVQYGLHLSAPQGLGVSFSLLPTSANRPFFQLIPGLGAHKACVGFAWSAGLGEMGDSIMALKLSVMQSTEDAIDAPADQTYVGIEWQHAVVWPLIMYTFGIYGHVGGDDPDKAGIFSYGVGLNF